MLIRPRRITNLPDRRVAGPAWLRIDTWRDGTTFTRYQLVAQGWQDIALVPKLGQSEALLRVHRRVVAPEQAAVPTRHRWM